MSELYPGYIVKANGEKGKITSVNLNTVVVQLSDHKATFKREDVEVLEATPNSDVKTYKLDDIRYCEDCGKPKPIEEFSRLKGGTRRKQCKECFGNRIRNGRNKKYAPKPFEFSTPRKESELEMIEPVIHEEIKTVKEWVEVNLKTNGEVKKTTETLASHLEYFEKLSVLAIKVVESIKELDMTLKQSEVDHE